LESNNKIIHGLWIGHTLSPIELLCIKSFMFHGHEFHLWTYDVVGTILPESLILEDASLIIPAEKVFAYSNRNQYGHGKGSFAGFSDIFRYKLLYEKGGWWVDMDVCCLKPFDFVEEYVFRSHHDLPVVGNIMKCPKGSELMRLSYEEAVAEVNSDNKNWKKPIQILNRNIVKLDLKNYILTITNSDKYFVVRSLINSVRPIPEAWYAIHWTNEEWRAIGFNKNAIKKKSVLGQLLTTYNLFEKPRRIPLLINQYKLSWGFILLKKVPFYFYHYLKKVVLFHSKN